MSELFFLFAQLCVVRWREHLFMPLQAKLTRALLELIKKERRGQSISTGLVSDVINCYFFLGEGLDGKTTYDLCFMHACYYWWFFVLQSAKIAEKMCHHSIHVEQNSSSCKAQQLLRFNCQTLLLLL